MRNLSNKQIKIARALEFWAIELPIMLIAIVGLIVFIQSRDAEAKLLAERSMAYTGIPLIVISYLLDIIRSMREKTIKHNKDD